MGLPKRLTQDEAATVAITVLVDAYDVDYTVAEYVDDITNYARLHGVPAWPSVWGPKNRKAVCEDFAEWCFGTAWQASL